MSEQKPHRLNPEMLVGISAVIIGVCALAVSLYETSLMRQEQRASVLPYVELARSYTLVGDPDDERQSRLWFIAQNVGIGPAQVRDFRVTVDGELQPTWEAAIQALLGIDRQISYGHSVINGRTIPVEGFIKMFELNEPALARDIVRESHRLDYQACYCSFFDECWITSMSAYGTKEPVDVCPSSPVTFIE